MLALAARVACAQSGVVRGSFADTTTRAPVAGVQVRVTAVSDSADVRRTVSADDGTFRFDGLPAGAWRLDALRMGYAVLRRTISLGGGDLDLGVLAMQPMALSIPEIVVKSSPPPAVQKGDTTEFSSRAVRTHPDATAEELVAKLPGVTVDNAGGVKHNGETIQQVLVDGKPYFGTDPTLALRNLPADVIEKIQVFDKLSDQAEFTGVDDGQTTKTMNVVLRTDHALTFGKAYAGQGGRSRYQAGGHVNVLSGDNRFAAIGLSNNVNQQNFSSQDLLGVLSTGKQRSAGRPPGGDRNARDDTNALLVGAQDGITTTNAAGVHVDAPVARLLDISQSYFFNAGDNHNQQDIGRRYAVLQDSAATYAQRLAYANRSVNQRLDGRITWKADSSVIDVPRLYFQSHHSGRDLSAENDVAPGDPLDQARNQGSTRAAAHDLSNHALLQHRFGAARRTPSLDIGANHTLKDATGTLNSIVDRGPADGSASDTLDQRTDFRTTSGSLNARLLYTEPVGRNGRLLAVLAPGVIESQSARHGWLPDSVSGAFAVPEGPLTNTFRSVSAWQSAGIGYAMRTKELRLTLNLSLQRSTLRTERILPDPMSTSRTQYDALPSLVLTEKLRNHRNLRVSLTTAIRSPIITQLQDVVDNANPLALSIGNPGLRPQKVQTLVCRYAATDPARSRSTFLGLSLQRTSHVIGLATRTAVRDTVVLGVPLPSGAQLLSPVNLKEAWSANAFGSLSWPARALRSLVNLNTGATWTRTPGILDQTPDRADVFAISQGIVLASNISSALDFTLSYTGTYNIARASLRAMGHTDYYTQAASLRLNTITWKGVVMRQEINHTVQNGVTPGYGPDVVLWNGSLGGKLFRNRIDMRFTATDVLAQNRSTDRTVTDAYVQDTRNQTLPRYMMLTATYTWGQ